MSNSPTLFEVECDNDFIELKEGYATTDCLRQSYQRCLKSSRSQKTYSAVESIDGERGESSIGAGRVTRPWGQTASRDCSDTSPLRHV
jgi:hypothetical protein